MMNPLLAPVPLPGFLYEGRCGARVEGLAPALEQPDETTALLREWLAR